MSNSYLHPDADSGAKFFRQFHGKGKVVMLNLLRFRNIADYSQAPELKPDQELTGKEAYRFYMECTLPTLEKAGSKTLFFGSAGSFLIGPEAENWDAVLLVEHESAEQFIAFAQDKDYLRTAGHRTAALEDSRLLPISPRMMNT